MCGPTTLAQLILGLVIMQSFIMWSHTSVYYVISHFFALCDLTLLRVTVQFFDMIVLPLFNALVSVLPSSEPMLRQVKANHQMWLEAEAAAQEDSKSPSSQQR